MSPQEQLHDCGITCTYAETSNKHVHKSSISDLLQLTVFDSQTQQQMKTQPRFELTKQISEVRKIQNGDPRKYKDLLANG